ncbi:MAG: DUF6673 family protein [Oscillospiraceae bacterium]
MWEINGLQIEFDIEDVETAEKVENALTNLSKAKVEQTTSLAETIRQEYILIKQVFIDIFTTKTADNIFKDIKLNRRLYSDVLYSFYDYIDLQKKSMLLERSNRLNKYIPKK